MLGTRVGLGRQERICNKNQPYNNAAHKSIVELFSIIIISVAIVVTT